MGGKFNHALFDDSNTSIIPSSVTRLVMGFNEKQKAPEFTNVETGMAVVNSGPQIFNGYSQLLKVFPQNLIYLKINLDPSLSLSLIKLPNQICYLEFQNVFIQKIPVGWIPSSVQNLSLKVESSDLLVVGSIPTFVKLLNLVVYGDKPIGCSGIIPKSVKHLTFDCKHPLVQHVIPYGVEVLKFANEFDQDIKPYALPNSIKDLYFGSFYYHYGGYSKKFRPNTIPASVRFLQLPIHMGYDLPIEKKVLPIGLEYLVAPYYFKNNPHQIDLGKSMPLISYALGQEPEEGSVFSDYSTGLNRLRNKYKKGTNLLPRDRDFLEDYGVDQNDIFNEKYDIEPLSDTSDSSDLEMYEFDEDDESISEDEEESIGMDTDD